jgi:hypothetical protein
VAEKGRPHPVTRRAVLLGMAGAAHAAQFRWKATGPLIAPLDRGDRYYSIKDPSIVRHGNAWHLFCTVRGRQRSHQIEYLTFADWSPAAQPKRQMLQLTDGYFCAPQVFYFRPHRKWYLLYQVVEKSRKPALQPAWSATSDLTDPSSWSAPKLLFAKEPAGVRMWIDFWVICDDSRAHLFYTSLDGKMWRAETALQSFPEGWNQPRLALEADIYEASHTYRLKGQSKYLTVIEAQGALGRRYHKAYFADRLDGPWTGERLFASPQNVSFAGTRWSDSISHGELLRDGNDETLTVDPVRLAFLFQGAKDEERRGRPYGEIPWRLGLLEALS